MNKLTMRFTAKMILSICVTVGLVDLAQAQNGCSQCVSPASGGMTNRLLVPWIGTAVRYQTNRIKLEDSPPLSSPYYSTENEDWASLFVPMRRQSQPLVPTDSVTPTQSNGEKVPSDNSNSPKTRNPSTPSVTEKIGQRYTDPRVVRMLKQLTPQRAESFYIEVSQLIDDRHLQPPTYSRRVDNALDHLIQAMDVPAFTTAAHVQGTAAEISSFQEELQKMRTQVRIRNRSDAVTVMRDVQAQANRSFAINPAAIGLEFLYGATDSLDQFSMLLPPEKMGGPSVGLRDNVVGIGVEIESHPSGLKILKLIPGGPAAQADLRIGDIITHIDGREVKPLDLNRAVDLIVGPVGTPVHLQASRGNRSGTVTLTRQKIALHSVVDVKMQDADKGIGYLKLEQFSEGTMSEIDAALMKLHRLGMKSLIMDLRGNPGGLLTTAIALADRFLPDGVIVATRGRTPEDNSRETAKHPNTWKVPLVVLIDHNSASASEIFAASIQENRRGIIVGEKSYGKGTVQTLFPLETFPAALRLTTAKFYSPDGREMAGAGVTPDVKVPVASVEPGQKDAVLDEALKQINDPRTRAMAERFRRSGDTTGEFNVEA